MAQGNRKEPHSGACGETKKSHHTVEVQQNCLSSLHEEFNISLET